MQHQHTQRAQPADLWAAALVLGLGICLLFLAITATVFRYVQPGFRPWVGVTGVFLIALGMWSFAAISREKGIGTPSRAGWFLLLPILLICLVLPGALTAGVTRVDRASISAGDYPEFGPGLNDTTVRELVEREEVGQDIAGARVRLVGMVQPTDHGWVVLRYRIICCAADAIPYAVPIVGAEPKLAPGSWAEINGVVEKGPLAVRANAIIGVRAPERPYQ